MPEPTFAKEDVWTLGRSILDDWHYDDERSYNIDAVCRYCRARTSARCWPEPSWEPGRFPHNKGCAVPIALDVLTGSERSKHEESKA